MIGTSITVTVGTWSQTWTVGDDIDVDLISDEGAVLDGLTAEWKLVGPYLTRQEPTTASFAVYVPEGAAGPSLDQGTLVTIVVLPPEYDEADAYDPLLELVARITDGEAVPSRDGLVYSVVAVDLLAELAELNLGGAGYPEEDIRDRFQRIAAELAHEGVTFEFDPDDPIWGLATAPFTKTLVEFPPASTPALDLIDQHCLHGVRLQEGNTSHKIIGITDPADPMDNPGYVSPIDAYFRPYVVPCIDDAGAVSYRLAWQGPRVPRNAGLPLRLEETAGLLSVAVKADAGELPERSYDGAWIPGGAVSRAVTWRVDKAGTPNRARARGWFRDWSHSVKTKRFQYLTYRADLVVEYPDLVRDFGAVEVQVDLPLISPPNTEEAIEYPHPTLWALLGRHYDASHRYTLSELTIATHLIADGRQWPRLFQQRNQDPAAYFSGAPGRFCFLYGIAAKWNPHGRTRYWGQLVGANMTISRGRVQLVAKLTHRLPGPNGVTNHDAVTWEQVAAEFPDVTTADVDPSLSFADMTMTTV